MPHLVSDLVYIFSYTRERPSFWALICLINSSSRMFKNVLSHAMPSKQSARLCVPLVAMQSLTHSLQKKSFKCHLGAKIFIYLPIQQNYIGCG